MIIYNFFGGKNERLLLVFNWLFKWMGYIYVYINIYINILRLAAGN